MHWKRSRPEAHVQQEPALQETHLAVQAFCERGHPNFYEAPHLRSSIPHPKTVHTSAKIKLRRDE